MSTDARVTAFLQNKIFEQIAAYLAAGRPFASTPTAVVKERWVEHFAAFARTLDRDARRIADDLEAELKLRGEELPYEAVKEFTDMIVEKARASISGMSVEELKEMDKGIMDDIERFEAESAGRKS